MDEPQKLSHAVVQLLQQLVSAEVDSARRTIEDNNRFIQQAFIKIRQRNLPPEDRQYLERAKDELKRMVQSLEPIRAGVVATIAKTPETDEYVEDVLILQEVLAMLNELMAQYLGMIVMVSDTLRDAPKP